MADESAIVPMEEIELDSALNYVEKLIEIVDRKEKQLRNKVVSLVKVIWKHRKGSDATRETEAKIRKFYPRLFE